MSEASSVGVAQKATLTIPPSERRRLVIVLGAVAALVVVGVVYATAFHAPFIWDDHTLLENPSSFHTTPLRALFTQPFWPDTSASDGHVPYYRPLTLLSYRFDLSLGGEPDQFHFTNIALHLVVMVLLAFTAVRLGASGRAGVIAALLWAIAPRLTESVAWISGRTDVLAAVFGLGALAVSPATRVDSAGEKPAWWRLVLSACLLLGAFFSKESGLAFAAALLVASFRGSRPRSVKMALAASAVVPLAAYGVLRWLALRHHGATRSFELSPGMRGLTVLEAVGRYAEMTVDALRPKTSIGLIGEPDLARAAVGAAVLVAMCVLAAVLRHRLRPGVVVAAALGVTALAPVLHVAPLNLSGSIAADRLLYVPLAGLALAVAVAVKDVKKRFVPRIAMLSVAGGVLFALATKSRIDDYTTEARFWLAAAERAHPHNASPRNGLAGVVVPTENVALACKLYEVSRDVLSSSGRSSTAASRRTRENLASCWAREGRYDGALALTEELAREFATSGRIKLALGYARLHVLDFEGAAKAWHEAEALDSGLQKTVQLEVADLSRARKQAAHFGASAPAPADAYRYADFLTRIGRLPEAELAFSRVASDPASDREQKHEATRFLVRYGHIGAGHDAFERFKAVAPDDLELGLLESILHKRTRLQASVTALRPRIERLAQGAEGTP